MARIPPTLPIDHPPPQGSNGTSLSQTNARALGLLKNRLDAAFSHMEHSAEWGKLSFELSFEEGRAVNKVEVQVITRDKL